MLVCLERSADLYMFQLMPLPLTVSCFSKIQIGFAFLVPAHLGSSGKRAVKWVCVCVCVHMKNRTHCLGEVCNSFSINLLVIYYHIYCYIYFMLNWPFFWSFSETCCVFQMQTSRICEICFYTQDVLL